MPRKATRDKRILNCLPSRQPEQDWGFEHAVGAGLPAAPRALSASKDLREPW